MITDCEIGFWEISSEDLFVLNGGGCMFHREGLSKYLTPLIKKSKSPIHCMKESCKTEISHEDLINLFGETKAKVHIQHGLNSKFKPPVRKNEKIVVGLDKNCGYLYYAQRDKKITHFTGEKGLKEYCVECECLWHDIMTCPEYQMNYGKMKEAQHDREWLNYIQENRLFKCRKGSMYAQRINTNQYVTGVGGNKFGGRGKKSCEDPSLNDSGECDKSLFT